MLSSSTNIDNNTLIKKAEQIAARLLKLSTEKEKGITWSVAINTYDGLSFEEAFDIEEGAAGILWFYLELYKQTKKNSYLDSAVECGNWITDFHSKKGSENYAFMNGYAGVSYIFFELFISTDDSKWKERALEIIKPCIHEFLTSPFTSNGFFYGRGGTLLVLLYLYSHTQKKWLLDSINRFISYLINEIRLEEKGVSWFDIDKNIKPSCNFAMGTAGLSHLFCELSAYTGNEAFYYIAKQAIQYENGQWDDKLKNWPDFRKEVSNEEEHFLHIEKINNMESSFFKEPADDTSLAFGTSGIGLSRLFFAEKFPDLAIQKDIEEAFKKLQQTKISFSDSFSLLEGPISWLPFLFEYYKIRNEEGVQVISQNIIRKIVLDEKLIDSLLENKKFGLAHGASGVGMLCLSLLGDVKLLPLIRLCSGIKKSQKTKLVNLNIPFVRKKILKSSFGRTISLLEEIATRELSEYLDTAVAELNEKEGFVDFVESLLSEVQQGKLKHVEDVFLFEKKKADFRDENYNLAYRNAKEMVLQMKAEKLLNGGDKQLLNKKLVLAPSVQLMETKWNWEGSGDSKDQKQWVANLQSASGSFTVMLRLTSTKSGVQELWLGDLSALLLNDFRKIRTGKAVIEKIVEEQGITNINQVKKLEEIATEQVKEFIHSCILVEA